MAITGIAISAAPLVLPPIVVFSAMGVAFSIPSGFVFASYACTNKLMTTLLPMPPSPVLLEQYADEDENEKALMNEGVELAYEADKEVETPEPITVNEGSVEDKTNKDDYFVDGSASNVVSEEIFKDVKTAEPVTVNEDSTVEDDNFLDDSASNVVLEHVEDDETTEPVIVREIETEKQVKDGSENDEPIGEMHRVVILSPGDEGNNFNSRQVEELDLVARQVVGDVDQDTGNIDSDEKVMRESMGTQEEAGSDIRDEGREDSSLRTRKDHSVNVNVGAMKIDEETGLILFDDQNTSVNFKALEAGGELKGDVGKNVDVLELPAFRQVSLDTDNAEVTSKTNTKTPSREDALNDMMIWEKIGEKRAIEHMGEMSLLSSRLVENKGKEPLLESELSEHQSKTREVTVDSLEDIVKGSTGLLEKLRDEGRVNDNTVEDDNFSVPNVLLEEIKEVEKTEPATVKEIETQILVKGGSKNKQTISEMHHAMLLSAGNQQNNFNLRGVEALDLVSREVVVDFDEDGGAIDYHEKVMTTGGGIISDQGTEDVSLGTKKDHLIHANADAREMGGESGLGLFDDLKTSMESQSSKGGGASKEIVDQNVDELALPAFRNKVSLDTDNGSVTSKMKAKTPSREGVLEDEKIWEKIVAMRTIVGYNAPRQPTCMGELKALYVFAGVEPPATFEGNTDLDDVNGKLKFLMAIVGVK
uniref:uncharacterized protein LOC122585631 n=1 Tax=Erigeron canadensis TaxID=72917 RepID=UPI001CB8AEB2|nr:uncharacterized protein LOC122585631 [Erigeron canadensis]